MDLTHRCRVPAPIEDVWAALKDLDRIAPCFPGATLAPVGPDDYTGSLKVKLGPVALVYQGTARYRVHDLASRTAEIELAGDDKRGNGAAEAVVTAVLTQNGDVTDIDVATTLSVAGKPAQFGPGVISDAADKLWDQFASCLVGRFADGSLSGLEQATTQHDVEPVAGEASMVELGRDLGDIEEPAPAGPKLVANVWAERREQPRVAPAGPPVWVPAANHAESDFEVIRRVVPPLLKRYWPVLGGAGVAAFVVSKVSKGQRR